VTAPRLVTAAMVEKMHPGSIVVDLGADGGGNCELSQLGRAVVVNGVKIIAPLNLPATVPAHASLLFSRNLTAFMLAFTRDKAFQLDLADDIQKGSIITQEGKILNSRTLEALSAAGAAGARA
jgi:NAD(P) transhydrogenase subunit alpha